MSQEENYIRSLYIKDSVDTAELNHYELGQFLMLKDGYIAKYGRDHANVLLAEQEKVITAKIEQRKREVEERNQTRWDNYYEKVSREEKEKTLTAKQQQNDNQKELEPGQIEIRGTQKKQEEIKKEIKQGIKEEKQQDIIDNSSSITEKSIKAPDLKQEPDMTDVANSIWEKYQKSKEEKRRQREQGNDNDNSISY